MDDTKKKELYDKEKQFLQKVSTDIITSKQETEVFVRKLRDDLRKQADDVEYLIEMLMHRLERQKQLEFSSKSPYFVRCDMEFDDEKGIGTYYFGRFPFSNDAIYSWVAPVASVRFESPGKFFYTLPSGEKRSGRLLRKDQFMIVNNKILFMSTEATDYSRELVYQEYFSERKVGFVLPEIVEQMEKAQDTIIRSHYFGSFLISGAAGSGKTTLALHRVAYLVQSPETERLFQPSNIIVFVQDSSTKKYFSALLPELGIYRVNITTFDEWAMKLLEISNMRFVRRYGGTETEKDSYEHSKNKALQIVSGSTFEKQISKILTKAYESFFSDDHKKLLERQLREKVLDRFDLTILLKLKLLQEKELMETVGKFKKNKNGRYVKKLIKQPANYSLIVIDEAENYLQEQIRLMKVGINPDTNAVIYVGDLVQQTLLYTIKDWGDVHEGFAKDRQVILQKVYRSTRQILEYIKSVGFKIEIPAKLKEGKAVVEKVFPAKQEEINYVKELISKNKNHTVGILAKTAEYIEDYKKKLPVNDKVFVMTINEAQGVEFDKVILVGINKELYRNDKTIGEIAKERKRVNNDLIYVALTRAMSELYVLGTSTIKELLF